ncbi:MAG TPA: hypothetical protein VGS41_06880 [Chthonomonadales bacterium]|nr:hypothetical protein [Chthonomonadales bacterium]
MDTVSERTETGAPAAPSPSSGQAPRTGLTLSNYTLLVAAGAFATTFAQSRLVANYPTLFLLKDQLHLTRGAVAVFFFWATFAWNIKPLAGILTDAFPLLGTRRRSYMIVGSAVAALFWLLMSVSNGSYALLLLASIGMNVANVFASTVMGGLMVEAGQAFGAPGRISALRQYTMSIAGIGAPLLGGWLASKAFERTVGWRLTTWIGAATMATLAVLTVLCLKEQRKARESRPRAALVPAGRLAAPPGAFMGLGLALIPAIYLTINPVTRTIGYSVFALLAVFALLLALISMPTANPVVVNAQSQLVQILRSRTLWLAVVMLFLVYTVPGLGTALSYRQEDVLKFPKTLIGSLDSLSGIFGVLAAGAYVLFCRRFSLRVFLPVILVMNAAATLLYLDDTRGTAPFIHALGGLLGILNELAIMDLAVRSTPAGCEGLGFALMMSVRNFGLAMSDVLGTKMMDQAHISWNNMVIINASTTLLAVVFTVFLPKVIVSGKDEPGGADLITGVLLASAAGLLAGGAIAALIEHSLHSSIPPFALLSSPVTVIGAMIGLLIVPGVWRFSGRFNAAQRA